MLALTVHLSASSPPRPPPRSLLSMLPIEGEQGRNEEEEELDRNDVVDGSEEREKEFADAVNTFVGLLVLRGVP